jgi:hypothetical protein
VRLDRVRLDRVRLDRVRFDRVRFDEVESTMGTLAMRNVTFPKTSTVMWIGPFRRSRRGRGHLARPTGVLSSNGAT